jgi:polyketide biosynthesis acyl carrier protein
MDRESIFEIVKANALKVLVDVKPEDITIDKNLAELGADSVARVEVVIYSMEDLGLDVPRTKHNVLNNCA